MNILRIANSLFARIDRYRDSLLSALNLALERARIKGQASDDAIVSWFKSVNTRSKIVLLTWWYRYRRRVLGISSILPSVAVAILLLRYWCQLDSYLSTLEKSVISGLVIGIGAAITGIIAIAFSLSLFAIQQVADRGTPATVQAYARDGVLRAIYWALVTLAMICFGAALLKTDTMYRTVTVVAGLLSLFFSFILLNFHFRRVVKFADPRYTISRFYKRGEKQLKMLQTLRATLIPKGLSGTRK